MKIHRRLDGRADGIPLVLINGLFADLHSWDGAMVFLDGFRVLRYDGRGQGAGEKPAGPYTLELLLADLVALMDELNWPATWLVGISNGGCIALEAARRLPQRVLGVVAADCYDRVSPLLRLKIGSWLAAHKLGGPSHRFDIAAPWIWSEAVLAAHPELVSHYREKAAGHEDHAVCALLEGALAHEIAIEQIDVPSLLLAGEQDLLTPPFQMAEMAAKIAGARFQTVAGAHASLLEDPTIFRDVLVPFIESSHVG